MFPGYSVSCSNADNFPPSLSTCIRGSEKWERRIAAERAVLLACPLLLLKSSPVRLLCILLCPPRHVFAAVQTRACSRLRLKGVKTSSPPSENVERSEQPRCTLTRPELRV